MGRERSHPLGCVEHEQRQGQRLFARRHGAGAAARYSSGDRRGTRSARDRQLPPALAFRGHRDRAQAAAGGKSLMSTSFEPTLGSLFGIPPVESPLSALARVLLEANRKPRSRSEWEARFSFWQKPASDTEETK